jgi:hypothetical protein
MSRVLRKTRSLLALVGFSVTLLLTWRALSVAVGGDAAKAAAGNQSLGLQDEFERDQVPIVPAIASSYDRTTPPGTGCETVVARLQHLVLRDYADILKGIRFANMWGYLGEPCIGRADCRNRQ